MKRKTIQIDGKRIQYHRWLMQQKLGRELSPFEFVHHINKNPKDNRIENLETMTPYEHNSLHQAGKNKLGHIAFNKLSDYKIERIKKLKEQGLNYSKIARIIGVSDNCVRTYLVKKIK